MSDDEVVKIEKLLKELEEKSNELDSRIDQMLKKKEQISDYITKLKGNISDDTKKTKELLERVRSTEQSLVPERKIVKISTGISKLDELLSGGIRTGTNLVLHGPPFSGKTILAYNFIAKSIKDDVPVIVVTTDRDINQIKYQVEKITDKAKYAEEEGILKFVDAYSRGIQMDSPSKYAHVVDNVANVSSLMKTVDSISSNILNSYPYYRLLFTSLTTYIPQMEEKMFIRFVQQFSQKRRAENSVSIYLLEQGLFEKSIYEAVSYVMDGTMEFRVDYSRNFLKVNGLEDVKSRDWIEMYLSDNYFDLGSFTLERIR